MVWRVLLLLPLAFGLEAFERIDLPQLAKETENPDYFTLIYLYDLTSGRSHRLFPVFQQVAEIYQGAIRCLAVDCGRDESLCPRVIRDALPSIFAYIPEGYDEKEGKPGIVEREYSGVLDEKHIRGFVESNLVFLGDVVKELTDGFLEERNNKLNRVVLFTEKDHVPLLYHGFASKYKGRIDFAIVYPTSTSVTSHFNITEFPTLLTITKKGLIDRYDGPIVPSELNEFLRKYSEPLKDKKRPLRKDRNWTPEAPFREFDIRAVNSTTFAATLNSTNNVVIALFAKTNATEIWNPLVEKYSPMVTFFEFNCSESEELEFAKRQGAKRFPAMRIYSINRSKKSVELTFDDDEDLDEQILSYLNYTVNQLNDYELNWYFEGLKKDQHDGILLITNNSVNFPFRIAASVPEFKSHFRFAQYSRKSKELQQILQAQNFPTIVAIKFNENKEMRFVEYTGNLYDFPLLKVFIKNLLVVQEAPEPKLWIDRDKVEELYSKSYKVLCEKKGGVCVMGVMNGTVEREGNEQGYEVLQQVQREFRKDEDYHFGWFDGLCESELRDSFGLSPEDLPGLVLYVPSRGKTARYKGKFEFEGIASFLQDASAGKVKTTTLKQIAFVDRNCQEDGQRRSRHTDL